MNCFPSVRGSSASRSTVPRLFLGRFAKPVDEIDKCLRQRCFLETADNPYFFQDGLTAFGRFYSNERGTKLLDLGRRNFRRRNQRRVGQFPATRKHAAPVLLPSTANARKGADDAHFVETTFHRPADR